MRYSLALSFSSLDDKFKQVGDMNLLIIPPIIATEVGWEMKRVCKWWKQSQNWDCHLSCWLFPYAPPFLCLYLVVVSWCTLQDFWDRDTFTVETGRIWFCGSIDTPPAQMYSNNERSIRLWLGFSASKQWKMWILNIIIKWFWYLCNFKICFYWIFLVLLRYILPIKKKVSCCW